MHLATTEHGLLRPLDAKVTADYHAARPQLGPRQPKAPTGPLPNGQNGGIAGAYDHATHKPQLAT